MYVYIYIYCTCYPFLSLGSFGMIPLTISPMTSRCEVVIVYHVYPDSFPLCPHCIRLYHQFCWLNAHCWCWIFIFVGQTRICPWRYHKDLGGTWSSLRSLGLGTQLIYLPLCQKANPKNHSHMLITFRKFGSEMAWNLWPHETSSFRGTVGGWTTPLKNMASPVGSWDDFSPWKNKIHVPNHQPVI